MISAQWAAAKDVGWDKASTLSLMDWLWAFFILTFHEGSPTLYVCAEEEVGLGGYEAKTSKYSITILSIKGQICYETSLGHLYFFPFDKELGFFKTTLNKLPEHLLQFLAFEWNFSGMLPEAEGSVWWFLFCFVFVLLHTSS